MKTLYTSKDRIGLQFISKQRSNVKTFVKVTILMLIITTLSITTNGQCTNAPYGAYGNLTPTATGTWQNATTCGWRGEYSTITVTNGDVYDFQSSVGTDFITITTTANVALEWGTGTVTWTATFSGQIRFFTHTNAGCGTGTGCRTRRVRRTTPTPCNGTNAVLTMNDSYGDGWNGNTITLTGSNGAVFGPYTLSTGSNGTVSICLPDDCYSINVGGGSWQGEVSWNISNSGVVLANGGAPFSSTQAFSTGSGSCGPPPSACDNIIPIACGQTLTGSTTGALGLTVPTCNTTNGTGGVNIYSFTGNGDNITASLCGSSYDTKIWVFTGSCTGTLNCVVGNDDFCGLQSEVTFPSTPGTEYLIVVGGWGSSTGNYSLALSCVTPCGGPVTPGVISTNLTQTVDNDVVSWTVTGGDPIIRYEYMFNNSGTWTTLASTAQNLDLQLFSQGGVFEIRSVHGTPGCPVVNSNSATTNLECAPQFNNGPIDGDHITNVTLNSINNNSTSDFGDGNSPLSIDAYQNFTSLVTDLSKGSVYNLSVSGTSTFGSNQGFAAWIDWNGDGSFDVSENVLISGPTQSTTASVNVPTTAITGLVKMRVLCAWNTTPTADACALLNYSYGEIEEYSINIMEASTLPVTLLSFDSSCEEDYVRLNWQTESELNSSHFIVERSRDGNTWTKSLPISAAGTTNTLQSYSYNDLLAGQNYEGYYRLRQVDFDGQEEVFGPISAHCEGLDNDYMEVFPNPTNGNFTVRIYSDKSMDNAEVTIVNAQGKVVHQQINTITNGSTTLFFKRTDLEVGLYFVHINAPSIKIAPQKIIIH